MAATEGPSKPLTICGFPVVEAESGGEQGAEGIAPAAPGVTLGDLSSYDLRPRVLRPGAVYDPASDLLTVGDVTFSLSFLEEFIRAAERGEVEHVTVRMEHNRLVLTKHHPYPVAG